MQPRPRRWPHRAQESAAWRSLLIGAAVVPGVVDPIAHAGPGDRSVSGAASRLRCSMRRIALRPAGRPVDRPSCGCAICRRPARTAARIQARRAGQASTSRTSRKSAREASVSRVVARSACVAGGALDVRSVNNARDTRIGGPVELQRLEQASAAKLIFDTVGLING